MAKRPAFQFYPREYLTDEHVVLMSLEEQGAYVRLLCHQWLEGSLPLEIPALARLCGVRPTKMRKVFEKIAAKFVSTSDGRLVNSRLERARSETAEWVEKSRLGGVKSGEVRRKGGSQVVGALVEPESNTVTASATEEKEQHSVFANAKPDAVRRWLESPTSGEQQPAEPGPTRGELIALCRAMGYEADGRDASVIDALIRKKVPRREIAVVIEGLALLVKAKHYPVPAGQLLNMRMLYSSDHGNKMPVWVRASDAYWKADEKKKPVTLAHL